MLDLAGTLAIRSFLPAWKPADRDEPQIDPTGRVRVHPGMRAGVRDYLDAGLQLMTADAAQGGMQLPHVVAAAATARLMAANISAAAFAMLSVANTQVLTAFGTPAQIAAFARLQDLALHAGDAEAGVLLDLLTPLTKSWPSEQGLVANHLAIQVHDGYGYTRDLDVEQLYRDNRLDPMHEGTTGHTGSGSGGAQVAWRWRRGAVTTTGAVQYTATDGVVTLTLVRPARRNALDAAMIDRRGDA